MARAAQGQANALQGTDSTNAAQSNASAAGVNSNLNPFLTSELMHPQGFSQQDQTAMLSAAQGGAGGATAGITGQANSMAARTRNAGGFTSALDDAARSRQQAVAGQSEGIAGQNAQLKNTQQQAAAQGLQGLYNTDSGNALKALGLQDQAIGTSVDAGKSGWLQNATGLIASLGGAAAGGANAYKAITG
jgi:hypothetical protein